MKKYVIVRSNRLNSFGKKLNNARVINMFRNMGWMGIIIKEVFLKLRCSLPEFLFNRELIDCDADTIIIFDGHVRINFLVWMRKKNPNKRIILWLWNTAEEIQNNLSLAKVPSDIEIWSYSEYDCEHYKYNYNTTFFWKNPHANDENNIKRDVYFVGKDKGRLRKIKKIKEYCEKNSVSYLMHVVADKKMFFVSNKEYCKSISYDEVQKNILESKAILDLKVSETAGPSLRPLESVFYRKKLITDDKKVVNFKFYDCNNIYVLGVDSDEKIKEFLSTDYVEVRQSDIEYYNFENWLRRFEYEDID